MIKVILTIKVIWADILINFFLKKIHNENKINKQHYNKVINEKQLENEFNVDIVNTKQEINNKNNNSQPITSKKRTLKTLIDEYFNDMKKIIDKDFYIEMCCH